ncbi:hypothetical protein SP19_74 [Salmonella phage 19]|nr:hypothetical protein SP19_74 [Salmonella phage 19]
MIRNLGQGYRKSFKSVNVLNRNNDMLKQGVLAVVMHETEELLSASAYS